MSNPTEMTELDGRDFEDLERSIKLSEDFVYKKYLDKLSDAKVVPVPDRIKEIATRNHIRLLKMNKLTFDRYENVIDKLSSVYNALGSTADSLIMIMDSDGKKTDLYLGTRTMGNIQVAKGALEKSFQSHFPGSEIANLNNHAIEGLIQNLFTSGVTGSERVISAVSGIPSLRERENERFVQGMEKFMESMKSEIFSAILIADSVSQSQIEHIKNGYETLYAQLMPFAACDLNFAANESLAVTDTVTHGFSEAVSQSVTQTQSHTQSTSETESRSSSTSKSSNFGASIVLLTGGVSRGRSKSESSSKSSSSSSSTGESNTNGRAETHSRQEGSSNMLQTGNSRSLQISFENKKVTQLLKSIDAQLERLQSSEDFGLWNCSAYFISPDVQTSQVAASTFKAIMRGDNSAIETSYIHMWDNEHPEQLNTVSQYLQKLSHPLFDLSENSNLDVPHVSAGSLISGRELAIQMGLPRKSLNGLTVVETAGFGRSVMTYDGRSNERINVGDIFHMGRRENENVQLDLNSLTMHTFVTGSTGSGKSNTVYSILDELYKKNIPFLVIEPAKGEYKSVFGGRRRVKVFGTNPSYTELLRINPFRFPEGIHVLEHIDRLVEIFNACWPMYAAMPAILKDAIERSYEYAGWDLDISESYEEVKRYPTFKDLLRILPIVISESGFSEELKSNYIGALVTRIKSLTNGLIGRLIGEDEIDNRVLFDENCIIDLSRIGSMETKSLLMGILFIRLQEHRLVSAKGANATLQHVTVLEEAHHLLRRTSFEQSAEGSNLQGKAVEMLANAISEMRTYGEGFIIADQSPSLLDVSVIRNTNTKIILRLPEGNDRFDIGRAASLNENQMLELPKLKTGVAVIYQNNWLEPVLCQINAFKDFSPLEYKPNLNTEESPTGNISILLQWMLSERVPQSQRKAFEKSDLEELKKLVHGSERIREEDRQYILKQIDAEIVNDSVELWNQDSFPKLSRLVNNLLNGKKFIRYAAGSERLTEWEQRFTSALRKTGSSVGIEYEQAIIQCILHDMAKANKEFEALYFHWVEEQVERAYIG
ncbi:ATP-binding protein [Paenibacillus sp. FSL K6-2862]|uniref:ATP-binding protein n=1 Tax=Paenibacillus sp. FSL K6-2862 TaxID=2921484 RepID=UPI0030FD0376